MLEREYVPAYTDLIKFFDSGEIAKYLYFTDLFILDLLKKVANGDLKLDDNEKYEIKAGFISECAKKIVERIPLKLVREEQIIADRDNPPKIYLEAFQDEEMKLRICEDSGIDKDWYISSKITMPVTSLNCVYPR